MLQERSGSLQCECHVIVEDDTARRAKRKLVAASVIALLFMIGEVLGKWLQPPGIDLVLSLQERGGGGGAVWEIKHVP
jgi:hypothetical protein